MQTLQRSCTGLQADNILRTIVKGANTYTAATACNLCHTHPHLISVTKLPKKSTRCLKLRCNIQGGWNSHTRHKVVAVVEILFSHAGVLGCCWQLGTV